MACGRVQRRLRGGPALPGPSAGAGSGDLARCGREAQRLEDLCIHRGARLSKGTICKNRVVCPYHGWQYDNEGTCTLIPAAPRERPMAKARAFPHKVIERYGFAWVCMGEPENDVPVFAEWDDENFSKIHAGPYVFRANGFRALENFMDISHFPFVHGEVNGSRRTPMRSIPTRSIPPRTADSSRARSASSSRAAMRAASRCCRTTSTPPCARSSPASGSDPGHRSRRPAGGRQGHALRHLLHRAGRR